VALSEVGDNAAAADCFRKYVAVETDSLCGWRRLAHALSADGKFAEAIPAFEKAIGYCLEAARVSQTWAEGERD
jgi:predicted TPR repeat methyltransferase